MRFYFKVLWQQSEAVSTEIKEHSIATVLYVACVHMYIVSISPLPCGEISRAAFIGIIA